MSTLVPLTNLRAEANAIGKPSWQPMLAYTAALHERSIHPPRDPLPYPWEEIGPGYCYAPAFGHWDIIHAVMDVLPAEPEHARCQLLNNLAVQEVDGLVPGSIWFGGDTPEWSRVFGHPPMWPVAVEAYAGQVGDDALIATCFDNLVRQIAWFERERAATGQGFYYLDILTNEWESGVDEGIRFLDVPPGKHACIDATAHVYLMYDHAARWATRLGKSAAEWTDKAAALRAFIQHDLFSDDTGFFHDIWSVNDDTLRCLSHEGMWPVAVGAATPAQATRVIDEHLLNPTRFFSEHPITTVSMDDPRYEIRMWRGPAWNSITWWAARGCSAYGRRDAANALMERALDASAAQFQKTGVIWEFYHPHGGEQSSVQRKPAGVRNEPCPDYLGHDPFFAMARLYDATKDPA